MTNSLTLPAGYTARAPRMADLSEVMALRNLCWREFESHDAYTLEELRGEWTDPAFDLATDGLVVEDHTGRIVAWEEVYDRAAHALIEFEAGAVHPDARGRGVEDALMAWVEETARRHLPLAPAGEEVILRATKNARNAWALALLERSGMRLVRHFHRMEIDFEGPAPPPAWPEGISVRELRPDRDERAFFAARKDAFEDHWGVVPVSFEEGFARFRYKLENTPGFDPALFRAAMDGGEIAGICFTWSCHGADEDRGFVSHVGVRRPWRRRGIATALLLDAFQACRARGKKGVVLGVDTASATGATVLYEKAGMRVTSRYDTYTKVLRPAVRAAGVEK